MEITVTSEVLINKINQVVEKIDNFHCLCKFLVRIFGQFTREVLYDKGKNGKRLF